MGLTNIYVLPVNRIPDLFQRIRDGQAPERFTNQLLKDWGFTSTNDRAFIPLLKALGFLTADGHPTQRYHDYRDHSRSAQVLGQAIRDAYSDVFLIKERPAPSDRKAIEGKFKSYHNASDNVAGLMTKTFFALLNLADVSAKGAAKPESRPIPPAKAAVEIQSGERTEFEPPKAMGAAGLHYNIQIHLPATKDVEVYNAIFKSLKEHLFE